MLFLLIGISLSHILMDSGVLGFGLLVSLHAATMFVSKLVEEEHHFWYWASLAWMACLGMKRWDSLVLDFMPIQANTLQYLA